MITLRLADVVLVLSGIASCIYIVRSINQNRGKKGTDDRPRDDEPWGHP